MRNCASCSIACWHASPCMACRKAPMYATCTALSTPRFSRELLLLYAHRWWDKDVGAWQALVRLLPQVIIQANRQPFGVIQRLHKVLHYEAVSHSSIYTSIYSQCVRVVLSAAAVLQACQLSHDEVTNASAHRRIHLTRCTIACSL